MVIMTMAGDALALGLAAGLAVWLRYVAEGRFEPFFYVQLTPAVAVFFALFAIMGLYPGVLLSPPDELKRLSQSVTLGFLLLTMGTFLSRQDHLYSRGIFLMAWIFSLFFVPLIRSLVRRVGCSLGVWGYSAVVFGAGVTGRIVVKTFLKRPRLGLRPVAILDDDPEKIGTELQGVPVVGPLHSDLSGNLDISRAFAIIAMPGVDRARIKTIMEAYTAGFGRVILIPDLFGVTSLWVSAFDFDGILALDIRQKLLDKRRQATKRLMELVIIFLGLPLALPLVALIAILIKIDSPGPVFFRHQRIGFGGQDITIWKFRTMVPDADSRLQECLAHDPLLREEWHSQQKLRHDPRVTRLGRLLRATSLDELPQLYNVIRGELSLVGPRPIVWDEVEKYRDGFELYKRVKPGLTGLWQISGRSSTSYRLRVNLDGYYVRNWSVWFDIYILAKTPLEVLKRNGAC
jgi:Undecaprenyl-phosphate galactose phosphotransferase WbaP